MPRGAQPKVAERENRMTYAAIRLFLENGYERTTTAAIAQAAGMSPSAFFAVFANKEALLLKLTKWMYEKQFAVTHELLKLTPDRAHDALNDARNTVQICGRMDLDGCMDEYGLRYVQYPQDRAAGLVQGRVYASLAQGQEDPAMTEVQCPYCGETVTLGQWARKDPRTLLAYGRCSQEDELCGIYRHTRTAAGLRLGRMVLEMNDDLWDTYQTCLERQG